MDIVSLEVFSIALMFVATYWLLPRSLQLYYLVIASIFCFVFMEYYASLFWLLLLSGACYLFSGRLSILVSSRVAVPIGILAFILFLVLYKFKVQAGGSYFVILGASYYVMRMLHYLIESSRHQLPDHSFVEFLAYCFFLPTLFVGPINRFPDFVRDERRRRWDSRLFHQGLERILFGYFKVIVVANYLLGVKLADYTETLQGDTTALGAWMLCLEYGMDLYFRFGGYCDVAIGVAALLGFRIPENFNYPFIRRNIAAFWKSWHITLSSWCRDYIFIPVAHSLRSPAAGVLLSMIALGLWHEISARYIVWGLYHGVGIVIFQYWSRAKVKMFPVAILPKFITASLGIVITFNFVILSFAITRTDSLSGAFRVYQTIFGVA
tara:strand:+ start:10301 stop:11440 length:1140 start_codon:yes stop_codon:yes gene_type:complete